MPSPNPNNNPEPAAAAGPILRLERLSVGFGRRRVVASEIDLAVPRGASLGIVGPNGCGKTTLLKTIVGILPPVSGSLRWSGRARIGYVPQHDSIDPIYPFLAIEVVLLALATDRLVNVFPPRAARERAKEALARVGLANEMHRGYAELSGGQRQRVLVARALALDPDVLALDEPTAELDPGNAERVLDLILEMRRERGLTVLLVTHDLTIVARHASHVFAMVDGRSASGTAAEILTSERLTALYGHPMERLEVGGVVAVVAKGMTHP